jgi:hypothetical protein
LDTHHPTLKARKMKEFVGVYRSLKELKRLLRRAKDLKEETNARIHEFGEQQLYFA